MPADRAISPPATRRKPGRPRGSERGLGEGCKWLRFRVNPDTADRVEARARAAGITPSELLRRAVEAILAA